VVKNGDENMKFVTQADPKLKGEKRVAENIYSGKIEKER
jgi:hypothetical protein